MQLNVQIKEFGLVEWLAKLGGLQRAMAGGFAMLSMFIGRHLFMSVLISKLFYQKKRSKLEKKQNKVASYNAVEL